MYRTRVSTVYRRTFASVRWGPACPAEQRNITVEADAPTLNWEPCGGARRLVSPGWQALLESVDYWPMVNINS